MSINTSLTGVIIEGNTFAYGNFAENATPYGYDNCMVSTADANISKNYFSGVNNVDTIPLVVEPGTGGSPSCLITKNVFVRGATTVQAYIDVSNVGTDQVIVENEFDQYTTDGYNDNNLVLVPIGGANILYERNKNQTAIKQIHKAPYKIGFSATPSLCAFDRSAYTGDIVYNPAIYSSSNGYLTGTFPGISPNFFKNEGITMNYSAPFSSASAVKLVGQFSVVDGYNGVGVSAGTIGVYGINSGTQGYILFGNDNVYYLATLNIIPDSTPFFITSITLMTPYKGITSSVVSATFFPFEPQNNTNIFNFPLPGTYALTSGMSSVVGSTANLTIGSLLMFNNTTADNEIFTVQTITDATHFTISPSWGVNTTQSNVTAETGLATAIASFSINLSEALPTNVQVISTVIGAINTFGNSNLVSATYSAEITSDIGSNQSIYSTVMPGITFTLSASISVTASNSSYPVGFGNGSSICFSAQPNTVYTVSNVSGTAITLTIPYYGTPSSTATAVFFNNSISDISTYNPSYNYTTIGFGDPISLYIAANNATATVPTTAFATNTQYLKIDGPSTAYTGTNGILRYNFSENIQMAITSLSGGTPSSLFISESPLVVKYRW